MSKQTLRLSFPHLPPYNKVEDYIKSKRITNLQLPYCDWDKAITTPEGLLVTHRKKYEASEEFLKTKREFYRKHKALLAVQWEELKQMQTKLRDNFISLCDFVKVNEDKRVRGRERIIEDGKLIEQRTRDIHNIKNAMEELKETRQSIDKEIQTHLMYEKFLTSVSEQDDEIKSADEVVERFESLYKTKTELGALQQRNFEMLENAKSNMTKKMDEDHLLFLGMMNTLSQLQSRYRCSHENAIKWERVVNGIKRHSSHLYKDMTDVRQACQNLYLLMCRRKDETIKIPPEDLEKQFLYIKKTLQQLATVRNKLCEEKRRSLKKKDK